MCSDPAQPKDRSKTNSPDRPVVPDHSALEGPIAVDEASPDTNSDYGSSVSESDLTSLKSSVMNYVFENGRRYHAYNSGKYMLPNDETEQDRLDLQHHVYLLALDGRLTLAPITGDMHRVLDIGTGTGIWAIDFADQYPSAEIVGTDLSPIQPTWVPPNCRFEVDDAEKPWVWPEDHFDFIHSRNLAQSIRDWSKLIQQMFAHTKPGCYVEIVENVPFIKCDDGTLPEKSDVSILFEIWREAAAQMGLPKLSADSIPGFLEAAGFVDVQLTTIKLPYGIWPRDEKMKRIGRCQLLMGENMFHAYSIALLTRSGRMNLEEATALCDGAVRDIFNRKQHTYYDTWFITARKPEVD